MGLSGAKRLVNEFSIESTPGLGHARNDRSLEINTMSVERMVASHWIPVTQPDEVGSVRRQANRLAETTDLDETARGKAAIIATELASNLVRYVQRGEIMLALPPALNLLGWTS